MEPALMAPLLSSPHKVDATVLDECGADLLAQYALSLTDGHLDQLCRWWGESPGFVGSVLFEKVVEHAPPALRRKWWATGTATDEQAARFARTEDDLWVLSAMVFSYDLGPDTAERAFRGSETLENYSTWRELMGFAHTGERYRVPMSVWVDAVAGRCHELHGGRGGHIVRDVLSAYPELAVAVAADPSAPVELRIDALVNPGVPAHVAVAALTDAQHAEPERRDFDSLLGVLSDRPVMTAAEVDLVLILGDLWGRGAWLGTHAQERAGWELSTEEFSARVCEVGSTRELLELLEVVPADRWVDNPRGSSRETHPSPQRLAVLGSRYATPQVLRTIRERSSEPLSDAMLVRGWRPNAAVWQDQELLAAVLEHVVASTAPTRERGPDQARWVQVIAGERATRFTAEAIAAPSSVVPWLWACDVPWDGDMEALALVVPAGAAQRVGNAALMSHVLNALLRADHTGTLMSLVSAAAADDDYTISIGDLIASHTAATRP